jgi:nucleotide-binding universal stress UspA family protein
MQGPVICGVDPSAGDGAVQAARGLAERYALPLVYVHVLGEPVDGGRTTTLSCSATAHDDEVLVIDGGHPADRLVALAEEQRASFLVVGNHGPRSSLLGSVSADVARRAPCPVLVVPPTAPRAERPIGEPELVVKGGIVRFDLTRRSAAKAGR